MTKHTTQPRPGLLGSVSFLMIVVGATMVASTAAHADYSFGDWATDNGFGRGDAMPDEVWAMWDGIDNLDGLPDYNWTATPTTRLYLEGNQIGDISAVAGLTNLTKLSLSSNQISDISAVAGLTNLSELRLSNNRIETMDLSSSGLSYLQAIEVSGNPVSSVLLADAVLTQDVFDALMDGGHVYWNWTGFAELSGVLNVDMSGVDFAEISDLSAMYGMDDLTDLWLVGATNVDAGQLDTLLDNLDAIEGTDVEGVLHLTQADFDALNAAGNAGWLAAWDAEPGHHVDIVPEPSTLTLAAFALLGLLALRRRG